MFYFKFKLSMLEIHSNSFAILAIEIQEGLPYFCNGDVG